MAALDKDQVIEKFTKAYTAQNGKAPTIEAKGGWYSVDGGKNMRLAALDELADSMGGEAPAEKPAAEESTGRRCDGQAEKGYGLVSV